MKRVIVLLVLMCSTLLLKAQNQYATTQAGRQVLLKNDGTWEYVNNGQNNNVNTLKSSPQTKTNKVSNANRSTTVKSTRTASKSKSQYIRGSRGGCYYINSNGNKTYVDRSMCD